MSGLVEIAKIGKPHGVRGAVRIWPGDETSTTLDELEVLFIGPSAAAAARFTIGSCRRAGRFFVVELGLDGRNEAQAIVGHRVFADPAHLPELDEDEFYAHQLEGMRVVLHQGGAFLGTVAGLITAGPQEILVVHHEGDELLIPFVADMVEVDIDNGKVVVDPPEGLLDATRSRVR